MSKNLIEIGYLEKSDFNPDMSLKSNVANGRQSLVMVQGNFCGYCTQAKPAFQSFAQHNKNVNSYTIQIDSEKELANIIPKLYKGYRGVPIYMKFSSDGRYISTHEGGRDEKSLHEFMSKN